MQSERGHGREAAELEGAIRYARFGRDPDSTWTPPLTPAAMPAQWPTPDPGEVDLWLLRMPVDLAAEVIRRWTDRLPPEEQARARRFKVEPPRRQFVAARTLLRGLLGAYLDVPFDAIRLAKGPYGKPSLQPAPGRRPLYFNLSHTADAVLIAIRGDGEIGVDVEACRERAYRQEIARRHFHPEEGALLAAAAPADAMRLFHRLWTLKEAALKARGEGLRYPLENINASGVVSGRTPARLMVGPDAWRCGEVPGLEGLTGAVAWAEQ